MGSQSQAQAPQPRPMANNHATTTTTNGNGLIGGGGGGGGSISRINSLARQGSIYSVTLDDFQRSLMEPGQTFGSMNMDEFLKNIWTMEESQAMASAMAIATGSGEGSRADDQANGNIAPENRGGSSLIRQPSLVKQPSLSIDRTMSRKTVDEVWRDIIKTNPSLAPSGSGDGGADVATSGGPAVSTSDATRQTYGEMTLEAFLVKAGVVKDGGLSGSPTTPYTLFSPYAGNGNTGPSERGNDRGERMGPGSLAATLSLSPANGIGSVSDGMDAYKQGQAQAQAQAQAHHQAQQQQQASEHWLRNIQQQQAQAQQAQVQQAHHQAQLFQQQADAANAMYKRGVGNGGGMIPNMNGNGGYTGMASAIAPGLGQMGMQLGGPMALALAPNSPAQSPASDGGVNGHGNGLSLSPVGNYGVDGSMRGRKRGAGGPVEKVVERRQRRMIKNRESAARSRARKQAYTVELEAEVTQLKEENNRLKREKEETATHNKRLVLESIVRPVQVDGKKKLRRTSSVTF